MQIWSLLNKKSYNCSCKNSVFKQDDEVHILKPTLNFTHEKYTEFKTLNPTKEMAAYALRTIENYFFFLQSSVIYKRKILEEFTESRVIIEGDAFCWIRVTKFKFQTRNNWNGS